MKRFVLFLTAAALANFSPSRANAAGFVNGSSADLVLGQATFSTNSFDTTQQTFAAPTSVAIDPTTGKVFVADASNNRVLRFGSYASLVNNAPAEAVLGQVNFTNSGPGATQTTLNGPNSVFVNKFGTLFVADLGNNRVLMWVVASTLGNAAPADRVFGQPNYTTTSAGTSSTKMFAPTNATVDADDRMWVTEFGNNRVLRFDSISTRTNGAAANGVLGQPNFATSATGTGATQMLIPRMAIADAGGRLWVSDSLNNRVLRFDNAGALPNGSAATVVLGQPAFGVVNSGVTAAKLNAPAALQFAPDGSLWVSDFGNGRVLRFADPATLANGASASTVLGKPNFTTSDSDLSAALMGSPFGLAFTPGGQLWVTERDDHRILRFTPDSTPPTVAFNGKLPKTTTKPKIRVKGTASDSAGVTSVQFRVNNRGLASAAGTTKWSAKVRLKKGKNRIQIVATDSVGNTSTPIARTVRRQ